MPGYMYMLQKYVMYMYICMLQNDIYMMADLGHPKFFKNALLSHRVYLVIESRYNEMSRTRDTIRCQDVDTISLTRQPLYLANI